MTTQAELNDSIKELKADLGGFFLTIGELVFSVFLAGFIMSCLWFWFIVPLGAPTIGILHAVGIQLTMRWFARGVGINEYFIMKALPGEKPGKAERFGPSLLMSLVIFFVAWLVHLGV